MRFQKKITNLLGLSVLAVFASSASPAQSIRIPPHEKIVFKNGLTVLLLEKHGVPIVSFDAIVKAGAAADPASQEGLASMAAGLLRKGTKTRTAQQFSADLDYIGGSFGANAGGDFTTISAEFLTKDLSRGLELFSDAVLHPTFPQGEADKLLAQSLDAVKGAKDDPQQVLGLYYNGYLYGARPYGWPDGGDEVSLKHINRDAVLKFYETYYAPGNTILAVAGEFDAAELRKRLEEVLGVWPVKTIPAVTIPVTAPVKGKRLLLIDKPDATQTYFAFGNIGTTVPAIDLALQVLQKLHKEGLTPEQLASAKSYIKGQFPPSIETSSQLARRIAQNEFYGLDDNEVNQLEARIDAVTPEIAKQVIQKHFPADDLVFVLIGKASAVTHAVQKYAEKQDARAVAEPGFWPPPTGKK